MDAQRRFPIVGIGASAGGLQALEVFFHHLPADTGMALVVVTHLAPGRESTMPDILSRYTAMPVVSAKPGRVQPNHVYVCPPDRILTIKGGRLRLTVPEPDHTRFPIDQFLISLAEDCEDTAIGVLLSGGGSDGTLGMRAIKDHGGFTLAQGRDGSEPAYSEMPNSAVTAGVVDLVLPVEQMGPRLAELARRLAGPAGGAAAQAALTENGANNRALQQVSAVLLNRLGHDFSGYKPKTFLRRVHRRMQVLQLDTFDAYIEHLRGSAEEVQQLFRDLLIGVTSFFRDLAAFEALEEGVIPKLFENKGADNTVRVWVPGCATGEEAYSIAILLREHMDTLRAVPAVQIFATDIDEGALERARLGRYQPAALANISKERMQRFFVGDDAGYSISKDMRDMCVFSAHNVLRDPPFSRLDLISCRNLLIYFGADFQARVLPLFHFALKPSGILFLGTSENVSQHPDLFVALDKKNRIYQRRDGVITPPQLHQGRRTGGVLPALAGGRPESGAALADLRQVVEARVMEQFAPAHVVVNRDGDVLYYSAHTGKYLEAAAGAPNRQLLAMARKGLRLDLRAVLREALETGKPARRDRLTFDLDGRVQTIDLIAEPFGGNPHDPLFLVLFEDVGQPVAPGAAPAPSAQKQDKARDQMEKELQETRERLQLTIEEYETAVEELKSSNEELQSINEELQSTNEELETSREELQSVNEELNTVNSELSDKVEALDRANADLRNVFESTGIAIVFLDRQLVIRSFTPAATDIFKLISSDRGRPLTDIVSNLGETGDLRRDIQTVFEHDRPVERRVHNTDGRTHYFMRILPYRNDKRTIEGALVVFVNVTPLVQHEARQRAMLEELNTRVNTILRAIARISEEAPTEDWSAVQFRDAFLGRVRSMASCYDLLAKARWGEVALSDILTGELGRYRARNKSRVSIEGPAVRFTAPKALALGMVIHELADNAVQHGALSKPKGRLTISWNVIHKKKHDVLEIEWRESGGAPVKRPRRKGFGRELIDSEVKAALRGAATISYPASGVRARLSIPLESGDDPDFAG